MNGNVPNGYNRAPKTEIEQSPAIQAAHLLKIHKDSLPKLAMLRFQCETAPHLTLAEKAKNSDVSYITAQRWRKKGLLDPDNYKLALSIAQRLGPEYQNIIAENSAGLVIEAQRQLLKKLPDATAKEASGIAKEQQEISRLATGQATSIVEFRSREETLAYMEEAGFLIEGEIVEDDEAA